MTNASIFGVAERDDLELLLLLGVAEHDGLRHGGGLDHLLLDRPDLGHGLLVVVVRLLQDVLGGDLGGGGDDPVEVLSLVCEDKREIS